MTKKQALADFNETILPQIKSVEAKHGGRIDKVYRAEEWNAYTDGLCKDGLITSTQYRNWSNPF